MGSLRARDFLIRGLLAGLIAGLAAFAVAFVVGEPPVRDAIALEETATGAGHTHTEDDSHATGEEAAAEAAETEVPRSLQSTVGLLTGTRRGRGEPSAAWSACSAALALGRFGRSTPRTSTLAVAGIGFVSVFAMPFLAYPPNPPAVGSGETIGYRTALYFLYVAISIIAAVTAVLVARRLAAAWGGWYATLTATGGYLLVTLAVIVLMPSYNEVPDSFPAVLLYEFRVASFLTQLTLWAVLGITLAELVHRLTARSVRDCGRAGPRPCLSRPSDHRPPQSRTRLGSASTPWPSRSERWADWRPPQSGGPPARTAVRLHHRNGSGPWCWPGTTG